MLVEMTHGQWFQIANKPLKGGGKIAHTAASAADADLNSWLSKTYGKK